MASGKTWFVSGSLIAHGLFAVAIGEIEIPKVSAATAIEIAETETKKPPPPPPEPAKVDPEPPKPREPRPARRAAAPPPADAPPPPTNAPAPIDALPDFGLSLSGGTEGGGFAMAANNGGRVAASRPAATPAQPKRLAAALPPVPSDGCAEDAVKPKPRSVPQPAYTDQARAAQIQGKVRVQLTVDESGRVVDVKLLQGLGYGLDEAAIAAARQASFEPAQRCGKPSRATFNISMRFTL